jgi:hypothetical protein
MQLACQVGRDQGGERLIRTESGQCPFGAWGCAVFRPATIPHFQIWYLNNGDGDLLQVMHICQVKPDPEEIVQANQIAIGMAVHKEVASTCPPLPSANTEGMKLPQAPKGYSWEYGEQSQLRFLRPQGWHLKAVEQDGALAYFITREPIPPDAKMGSLQFETGISINVFRGVSSAKGMATSAYALAYVQIIAQSAKHETLDTWQSQCGSFVTYGIQFCSQSDIGPLRQQHVMIANDRQDTLYFVIFETPQRYWDRDWPMAFEVFENLRFHEEL